MTTLAPTLATLDERVLASLARGIGRRPRRVAELVHGCPAWRCDTCGDEERAGNGTPAKDPARWEARPPGRCWRLVTLEPRVFCEAGVRRPVLYVTPEQAREVREILRGLERVGRARQAGGWWRRA